MNRKVNILLPAFLLLASLFIQAPPDTVSANAATARSQIALGSDHSGMVRSDGSLWMWGSNALYALGTGDAINRYRPVKILSSVQSLDLGNSSGAAVRRDGTLWVWGFEYESDLGDGDTMLYRTHPTKILTRVRQVSLGSDHSGAVKTDGTLWMWGLNENDQLGTGDGSDRLRPVRVLANVKKVSLGAFYTAAIKNDDTLWIWGSNIGGLRGIGTEKNSEDDTLPRPAQVMTDVRDVDAGPSHTAAIKNDGSLWIWGSNDSGQLGTGDQTDRPLPTKIMDDVQNVYLNDEHSAALKTDGSLWVWGSNDRGQLGTGSRAKRLRPVKILDNVQSAALGECHGGALKNDGSLWIWGSNDSGQLGTGDRASQPRPVKIPLPGTRAQDDDTNTRPSIPQMEGIANTAAGITIKWTRTANTDGYYVYRRNKNAAWKRIVQIRSAAKTSYTDTTVKSKNGMAYSYTVKAYKGTKKKTLSAHDKIGQTILRLTAPTLTGAIGKAPQKARVTWKKNARATGYQIQYTASKSFAGAKRSDIASGKQTSALLTRLAKGRTYRIRIRCCKRSGSTIYHSAWSSVRTVKIRG